jgi:uncharacterized protein (TIGR02246 family)
VSIPNDEDDIRQMVARQETAWNCGDAVAYAERFHPEGTFPNVFGDRYIGQEAFQARHAAIFAAFAKGSKASLDVRRVFFAAPGMALVDIDCVLNDYVRLPPGLLPTPDGTLRTSLLQVLIKHDGEWRMVGYYNVDAKPLPTGART